MNKQNITGLFLDIGGVLLTDGWNRIARKKAAEYFKLDHDVMEDRHHITVETFELGKITLEEYLRRVVFVDHQNFEIQDFKEFIFAQSTGNFEMLSLIAALKKEHNLKIVIVSNESRELNEYRIKKFGLTDLADCFISSSFVRLRKPDTDMFKLALDISQVPAKQIIYIDDQLMFVHLAENFGINTIHHTDYQSTKAKLGSFGLCVINDSYNGSR
ncbi:HAD family hydrolase [Mucilaginibacter paludis]|uniref:HAD-superfamily hydrolase, subfamily IA, variant 3 n=1 Tax=Mucilaginibacter paludis DSM 18603 TaxID=714943 RepID=H1Y818_9SPHI|nr:HAD-IA family hydrolase [Mucilaginibacter paludis]EHQ31040.1 HAD-superfamily hydrolase, subfamily IA, variant 3 [Mucilaginibacter paludis DSM 18603]